MPLSFDLVLKPEEVDTVVYHENCLDGLFSALAFLSTGRNVATIGVAAGDNAEILRRCSLGHFDNARVAFVDLGFEASTMEQVSKCAVNWIVLDHHKSNRDRLSSDVMKASRRVHFDMNHSAAFLCWSFVHGSDSNIPALIDIVQDYDLFRFAIPHTRAVIAALQGSSNTLSFDYWKPIVRSSAMLTTETLALITRGPIILEMQSNLIRSIAHNAYQAVLMLQGGGFPVVAVNTNVYQSFVAEELLKVYPTVEVAVVHFFNGRTNATHYSIRSRQGDRDGGRDVSEIAQQFGGGGHRNAAGFKVKAEQSHSTSVPNVFMALPKQAWQPAMQF